ncbi:MAG: hypothetical protein RIB65_04305 [Ilumatobacter fluminis]|uniref:hypothetical protein n=1 Tax=Ilumatobacter fluminis TaxID=467091 RepID=UPI0032EC2890
MIAMMAELATVWSTAMLAASSEGSPGWLLLLGPAGGGGVYYFSWRYYRNTHQSHAFERETRIEAQSVTGDESKIKTIKGTKKKSIDGRNQSDHRRRVMRAR